VGKSAATLLGLAVIAAGAIYLGRAFLFPATERGERREAVLTGNLDPRLEEVAVVQDTELPPGVPVPKVGEDTLYIRVVVLYPALPEVPEADRHRLVDINGMPGVEAKPAHVGTEVHEDGARATLVFRVPPDFEQGTLRRGNTVVLESILLD